MWLAGIVYHIAFRYKKPHASLLNAKATRHSLSWSIHERLSDNAQVECCPQCKTVEDWNMQPYILLAKADSVFMPELNSTAVF